MPFFAEVLSHNVEIQKYILDHSLSEYCLFSRLFTIHHGKGILTHTYLDYMNRSRGS